MDNPSKGQHIPKGQAVAIKWQPITATTANSRRASPSVPIIPQRMDHFDSAYAPDILPRKKVDPWVIDFGWTATDDDPSRRPLKIWPRTSRIALKLLGRFPCVVGFILTQLMHVGFCLERKLTHNSLIFDGRRSTWLVAGRPTRIALKLLGRLPCVIGIILTQHMHGGTGYIGGGIFRDFRNTAVVRGGHRWLSATEVPRPRPPSKGPPA
ncbi:uncharacterized protein G2W53_039996 [Senna tora]|uniref:Uncharacterized protein n=1 Tax=Senna tora TaxID=362788 RepID=A0A834SNQ9_9FABA|nr:uncharacterized protein G2W53_039996 [Senna tora]